MAVEEFLFRIGILVIASAILALLLRLVKQPPLVSYLIIGLLISFFGFELHAEYLEFMVEIGIVLLLFIAGLEMKLQDILALGKKTFIIGEGHDVLMGAVGFGIAYFFMGLTLLASVYVAVGVTLSSTIVVVKSLAERKELASPHGKILVGTMILQDLLAMLFLAVVTTLGTSANFFLGLIGTLGKIFFVFVLFYYVGKYILTPLFAYAARSIELVFLTGLAWCFVGIGAAYLLDFSMAIGAFIAGLSIAHLPFTFEIIDKVRSLQDFGIMLFFLSIGMQVELGASIFTDPYFYVLTAFVILFTPAVTSIIASFLSFTKKENFILSVMPTQISEFTLIIAAMGLKLGHITAELFSMITVIVVVTIALSSSYLMFLNPLYKLFAPMLDFLEWHMHGRKGKKKDVLHGHVVIMGFKKLGQDIAKYFKRKKVEVIVIEWQPELLEKAEELGVDIVYGDAGDPDLWSEVYMHKAGLVVSTIGNNQDDDIHLLQWLRRKKSRVPTVLETNNVHEAKRLYKEGAKHVLVHDRLEWNHLRDKVLKKLVKKLC
jgi:Kef-type K+ transport system membrane component KefB